MLQCNGTRKKKKVSVKIMKVVMNTENLITIYKSQQAVYSFVQKWSNVPTSCVSDTNNDSIINDHLLCAGRGITIQIEAISIIALVNNTNNYRFPSTTMFLLGDGTRTSHALRNKTNKIQLIVNCVVKTIVLDITLCPYKG